MIETPEDHLTRSYLCGYTARDSDPLRRPVHRQGLPLRSLELQRHLGYAEGFDRQNATEAKGEARTPRWGRRVSEMNEMAFLWRKRLDTGLVA